MIVDSTSVYYTGAAALHPRRMRTQGAAALRRCTQESRIALKKVAVL